MFGISKAESLAVAVTPRPVSGLFASFGHHEALWEVTSDTNRTFSGAYKESGQIIIFLREETAFTLKNKQNKRNLKFGARGASRGMAHSAVSTRLMKDETLTATYENATFDLTLMECSNNWVRTEI